MTDRPRGWRHPGWAWTVRHPRALALSASGGSLLLGITISASVTLLTGGLTAGPTLRLQWITFGSLGLAAVTYTATWIARSGRDRMLRQNGVAYIIRERARDWGQDSPDDFYAQVRTRFGDVVVVPGPDETGPRWDWPLDAGARLWDAGVTDLVRSFRVLADSAHAHSKEEGNGTVADGVFVTAWWAVALAFGLRLRNGIRNWELDVWQRPSDARAGKVSPDTWRQRPHRFPDEPVTAPDGLTAEDFTWEADLTVARMPDADQVPQRNPVSVLLLRFGRGRWGPLDLAAPSRPLPLTLTDAGCVVPVREPARVAVHELRCVPRTGARTFEWDDYPFLASIALDWIQRKARDLDGHTLLLGAIVPNEVALGLGIRAGRPGCDGWPSHMWPVMFNPTDKTLVVPCLDVGTAIAGK